MIYELRFTTNFNFFLTIYFLAVLAGDLGQFNDVIMNYKDKFIAEKTYTLIIR